MEQAPCWGRQGPLQDDWGQAERGSGPLIPATGEEEEGRTRDEPEGAWLEHVAVPEGNLEGFRELLGFERWQRFTEVGQGAQALLAGRTVWNLNSTARGGGVAELLEALLPITRAAGVDARRLVLRAHPEFFAFTKRLHNLLHASPSVSAPGLEDGGPEYESELQSAAAQLSAQLRPGDVLVVHDPQPAGLIPAARRLGVRVVWRCHVGTDQPTSATRTAWDFLMPYVSEADATVFSRASYFWSGLDPTRCAVIAPSIDPFTPKNQELGPGVARAVLEVIGLTEPETSPAADEEASFRRTDGSLGRVHRRAEILQDALLPERAPMVLQVSRWDRLKDPAGVLSGFAANVPESLGAHLVLAGPADVSDDPEGLEVWGELRQLWGQQPASTRRRIHVVSLPMDDGEENAIMVNALQRHASVVVQKSLEEGFGLTVAEAMWKCRPVLASRRGGIQDQVEDGVSGWLLDDPRDLQTFGGRLTALLQAPDQAARLGAAARQRVERDFLAPRALAQWLELLEEIQG